MYGVDPYYGVSTQNRQYVLGGGACIWGEYTDDGNIDDYIYPRAFSTSEVLWSYPKDRTITTELSDRFSDFTCKLRQMGVRSGPIKASRPCPGVDQQNPKYAK